MPEIGDPMSDEMMDAAPAESSPAPDAAPTPDQAPVAPAQTQEPPFHQHPRFRELTTANRELKQQLQQIQQQIQQQQRQQQSGQPQLSQEEQQAVTVLKKLMQSDPELAAALMAAKQLPQFQQRFQGMDQMQARAAQAHNNAGRNAIKEMATAAGLDTSEDNLKHIVRLVAGAAMDLENGNERYANGDLSVLKEAFDLIQKGWLSSVRKPAQDALNQTKNKLRTLPPPVRGQAAGQPAPPKLERGNERAFEQDLHSRAKKLLGELSQG